MTSEAFEQLAHGFLADYLEFYPATGAWLGLHVYDGRPGDFGPPAVDAFLRTLDAWDRRLAALDPPPSDSQAVHDAALIRLTIAQERFRWQTLREHEWNPIWWSGLLDLTHYLKRDYAPLVERLNALAAHLEETPRVLEQMRAALRRPLARPIAETAVEVFSGHLAFYADELPAYASGADDPRVRARLEAAHAAALDAVRDACDWLAGLRDRADGGFAIGEAAFAEMLRTGEMVDVPLDALQRLGEAEMARLTADLVETAARVDPGASPREVMARLGRHHPSEATLLVEVRALLDELRRFLVEREIITLPGEVRPIVEETPRFARWAFAMMDTAGPFEQTATESFYYVTPPEPAWPPERREEWLSKFDYATLKAVSIHEAYPGHFVHFMHVRRAPSAVARVMTAYSFVEGWAHYTEEMMLEAGVDPRPEFRLACLGEALVRAVRYLVAIGMHTGEMRVDEAARLFETRAFLEPLPARKEAERGTFDPGYLNYTLGKLMMRRLRDDYRTERGAAFALREFHDRLVALGAPPVPLARRALLADASSPAL
ncbi:MAG: DUF885 domain-containing protein [Armatimonadota bacterium]|nr:DUF885 domain-containing protein [Armatimonadota bacterium]MDR7456350.1 DUF885 domain-containing protein [Armatimonadota bacterium]MDR7497007.1 DUF885 domain-containing protein [Armatimonadota bacterium]MDR7511179.1 DUF885 domain-containing protein [Armatimonadota bacterium]